MNNTAIPFHLAYESGPNGYSTDRSARKRLTLEQVLATRLTDFNQVKRAEPVVTVADCVFARQGDFSLIMGQRKAGKTTVSQFIIATALMQRIPVDLDTLGIQSRYCEGKDVIYIDTEGSEEDTADFLKGVLGIMGKTQKPENFHVHRFREYTQDECKEAVELLFEYYSNSHLWLIDGIADLIKSPNHEQESNEAVRWVMKYANKLNTCMILVIHENPGDGNRKARGHLGSELERKSSGALAVVKDNSTKPIRHLIQSRYLRKSADFEDIAFTFDPDTRRPSLHILTAEERASMRSKDYSKTQELTKLRDKCFKGLGNTDERSLKTSIKHSLGPQPSQDAARMKTKRLLDGMIEKGLIRLELIEDTNVYFPINEKGEAIDL
ncbi:hypothetical protein [Fibrivirga algicola]|uniref:AAA family ATPase n=1 Tax=Fibrivirga algicola TaxID=2950420 RepID=A0ABX0QQE1_9BACT|nr:hypothetical protein [Fibrivirga algicola]NID13365.1 hypothetical protein [Fibrivirga algicola]